ncbi:UbiX family flavin prenyltransferase [Streptomyces himalayensis]|uniref:UbiX family flavin prenyltransferase n=1 Tax=Streptomyces himalayensis subsp. himalayensis TaxID=2756131 RepID=A0A7W0DUH9_9ACTN|nr:UbiX family flavin prenyltransferase [Streptomyces himalayensis]MBA2950679.1 UbiX family flavin prenyltransferase [Streptomyces himalayensis subsp. himalayensis]
MSGASGTPYAAAVLRALLAAGESVDLVVSRASRLTLLDETGIAFRDAHWRDDLREWLARGADGKPYAFPPGSAGGPGSDDGPGSDGGPVSGGGPGSDGGPVSGGRPGSDGGPRSAGGPAPGLGDVRYWAAGDLAAGPSSGSYPAKGMLIVPASTACVAGVALGLSKDLLQRAASVTLKEGRRLVVAVRETPLNGQTLKHLVTLDDAGAIVLPASPAFYAGATHIQDLVDFVAGRVLDAAGVPHRLYRRWEGELGGGARDTGV